MVDVSFLLGSAIIIVIANLILAVIIYKNNRKSITHILLSILSFIIILWTIFNALALSPGSEDIRLLHVRLVMLFTTPFGPVIFLLAKVFPNKKVTIKKKSIYIGVLIFNVITAISSMSGYMFTSLTNLPNNNFDLVPGPAIALYGVNFIGFMALGFIQLIKKYKKAKGLLKKQIGFFLFGLISSFTLLTLTNFIAVVIFRSISLTFLGPGFTIILLGAIAYSIIKHRFLDITFTLRKGTLALIMSIFLTIIFYIIGKLYLTLTPDFSETNLIITSIIAALIVSFLFIPLQTVIKNTVNKFIFEKEANQEKVLKDFNKNLSDSIKLKDVIHFLQESFQKLLQVTDVSFVIKKEGQLFCYGSKQKYDWDKDKLFFSYESFYPQTLVLDELKYQKSQFGLGSKKIEEITDTMKKNNMAVIAPIRSQKTVIGLIILGTKNTDISFSSNDIKILENLCYQIGTTIQNAIQHEEIQRFNTTLAQKIKIATEELTKSNLKVKTAEKIKSDLLLMSSHELRTPLCIAQNYLYLLKNKKAAIDTNSEAFQDVEKAIQRLNHIVDNMGQALTIASGDLKFFEPKPILFTKLLEEVIKSKEQETFERQITLSYQQNIPESVSIFGDESKLKYALWEIITNAIKFSKKETTVIVSAKQVDKKDKSYAQVSVIDNGKGISNELQKRIFKKDFNIENVMSKHEPGMGLGLYLVQKILKLHHGRITIKSKEGEGTTVIVELPAMEK
jgi:signal transduction histidine kinase